MSKGVSHDRPFQRYLIVALPGWLLAGVIVWVLYAYAAATLWAAAAVFTLWVGSDLAMYPRLRRYYETEPSEQRIVGETGYAITDVSADGFVRVRGELWQARAQSRIPKGSSLRVTEVRGLELMVEPAPGIHR